MRQISRMIRCGIPKRTAVKIYEDFVSRGKLADLETYIRVIEVECDG